MTCPAVVRLTVPAAPAVVRVAIPGPPGPSGGGASQSVRIDSTSTSNTIYVGKAPAATAESSTGWAITRTIFSAAGVLMTTRTASGAWTSRASLTYS
jgi:hypothetical protein